MRVQYIPLTEHDWLLHYANQQGGAIIGFKGSRFQRGAGVGSALKSFFRLVLPLAKSAGKVIGRQVLSTGNEILSDVLKGEDIGKSVKKHGRVAAGELINKGAKRLVSKIQTGKGMGERRIRKSSIKGVGMRRKRQRKDALGLR